MRGAILALALLWGAAPLDAQNLAVKAIVVSENSSYALLSDDTVWWWGEDDGGFWGKPRATLARLGNLSNLVAVSPPLALRADGTVWAYWPNPYGPDTPDNGPARVNGLDGAVAIAGVSPWWPSLALKRDGIVWAWGQNIYGQLGVRTFAVRTTPVQVVGPATP